MIKSARKLYTNAQTERTRVRNDVLLRWTEERSIDEKWYDVENPAVRTQLDEELEEMWQGLELSEEFAARARRLCEILL